jgi:hypothetical protein
MLCIVREGDDLVFATHEDDQDVAALYAEQTVTTEHGAVMIPRGVVVKVPRGFVFAYDENGRLKDPRRFAGEGGTPLGTG